MSLILWDLGAFWAKYRASAISRKIRTHTNVKSRICLRGRYSQSKRVPANEAGRLRVKDVLDAVDGGALGEFIPRGHGVGRSWGRW